VKSQKQYDEDDLLALYTIMSLTDCPLQHERSVRRYMFEFFQGELDKWLNKKLLRLRTIWREISYGNDWDERK